MNVGREQAILSRHEHRILGLMLLLLHSAIWWDFGGPLSRSLMLAQLGLFLLWQPLWRRDQALAGRTALLFIVAAIVAIQQRRLLACRLTVEGIHRGTQHIPAAHLPHETAILVDNGQTTRLEGIKGQGPSLATVEAAEDGGGVSTRQAQQRVRDYQKQFESFVQREDVPEQVKVGVKRYFEIIHEGQER